MRACPWVIAGRDCLFYSFFFCRVRVAAGASLDDVVDNVLRETYKKHNAAVFEGNGYSAEWREEVCALHARYHAMQCNAACACDACRGSVYIFL